MALVDNQAGPRPDAFQRCFLGRRRLVGRDADVEPSRLIKFRVFTHVSRRRTTGQNDAVQVGTPLLQFPFPVL